MSAVQDNTTVSIFLSRWRKPILFALLGGAGCLAGDLLAEPWQAFMQSERVVAWFHQTYDGWGSPRVANLLMNLSTTPVLTALLGMGVAMLLVVGQNLYLRRTAATRREALNALLGGALAGLVGGIVPEFLYGIAHVVTSSPILLEACRIVAWGLLGALIALGLSLVVPNLRASRAVIGGSIGGIAGGMAFVAIVVVTALFGSNASIAARLVGFPIIGASIGAMIALVEMMLAGVTLQVEYGPHDRRVVELGSQPLTVGSDRERCAVVIRGLPAVAYRYRLEQGRAWLEDVANGVSAEVSPGHIQRAGNVLLRLKGSRASQGAAATVDVNRAVSAVPAPALGPSSMPVAPRVAPDASGTGATTFVRLRRGDGRIVMATIGVTLRDDDVSAPVTGIRAGQPFAELTRNPKEPTTLGLRNLSCRSWRVSMPDGRLTQLVAGRTVRVSAGTVIDDGEAVKLAVL